MKIKKVVLGLFVLELLSLNVLYGQGLNVNLAADFVSSYVWRGIKQAGASVQPSLSLEYNGLSISAWASTDIAGKDKKEVDFTLAYAISDFNLSVTDYWWDGEYANRYFSYPHKELSGHLVEAGLGYTLPQPSFPLSLSWNTFFLGAGNKKENGDNSFSTYIDILYPFNIKDIACSVSIGFIPWKSVVYGSDMNSFKVTSIRLEVARKIKITDRFSIPIFANIITNPAVENTHFVIGFSIQ